MSTSRAPTWRGRPHRQVRYQVPRQVPREVRRQVQRQVQRLGALRWQRVQQPGIFED